MTTIEKQIIESKILFNSANIKFQKKEEIKVLADSMKLKSTEKKEINKLKNQIMKKKKQLFKTLKINTENTNSLLNLLYCYLKLNDESKVKMILENHIFFTTFETEFINKLVNLSVEEKLTFISRLHDWINNMNESGLLGIAEILEDHMINDKINLK